MGLQTFQLLEIPVNDHLLVFIFFATLGAYNAYWIISDYFLSGRKVLKNLLEQHVKAVVLIAFSVAFMVYELLLMQTDWLNIFLSGLLLILYMLPLMPVPFMQLSKNLGFLKTMLLAFTWAHVTTLLPLQKLFGELTVAEATIFVNRFLFMMMLCIIFDKRDVAVDKMRGLHSIATLMKPFQLHILMLLVYSLYTFSCYRLDDLRMEFLKVDGLFIAGILAVVMYLLSLRKRGYYFYYFGVDGLMFLSALLTYLVSI